MFREVHRRPNLVLSIHEEGCNRKPSDQSTEGHSEGYAAVSCAPSSGRRAHLLARCANAKYSALPNYLPRTMRRENFVGIRPNRGGLRFTLAKLGLNLVCGPNFRHAATAALPEPLVASVRPWSAAPHTVDTAAEPLDTLDSGMEHPAVARPTPGRQPSAAWATVFGLADLSTRSRWTSRRIERE